MDWASTQNNLGNALRILGDRESGTKSLEEAVAAFRQALQEWTREQVPMNWAKAQNNLGIALAILGDRERSTAKNAVTAFKTALEIFEAAQATHYIDITKSHLQRAEAMLRDLRNSKEK